MIHKDKHAVQQHVYQHTSTNNQDFDMYKSVKERSIKTKFWQLFNVTCTTCFGLSRCL